LAEFVDVDAVDDSVAAVADVAGPKWLGRRLHVASSYCSILLVTKFQLDQL